MMHLRPRQQQALDDLRAAYAAGHRAPVLVAPTGFGKTATAAAIIKSATDRGNNVWFLAHLQELIEDTSARLTSAGIPHGFIASGCSEKPWQRCQLVMVQTAARRLDRLPRPDLIIVDECHLAVATTYRAVIEAVGSPCLLGLSGTPERLDGRGLQEMFDLLVPTCSTGDLIAEGLLAPIRYYAPSRPDLAEVHSMAGDYVNSEIAEIMNQSRITGDAIEHYRNRTDSKPAVVFCVNIEHATEVAKQFNESGYRAVAIHGKSSKKERREAAEGLKSGQINVVANVGLWVAGVDIPNIQTIILLRPTKSKTIYLQAIGRGLRTCEGKEYLTVLDHAGCIWNHGPPDMQRDWSLEGRKKRSKGDPPPPVKECPNCFSVHSPAPKCPLCGHVYFVAARSGPEIVDGDLSEIDLKAAEKIQKRREQAAAQSLEQLQDIGRNRGYSPGWAAKVWESRMLRNSVA